MQTYTPGYPTDLRSDEQRMRAFNSVVGDFEWRAARVIARLTGEHVTLQDDNSQDGMVDIRIERPGLHYGYAEVVFDVDHDYAALADGVRRRQRVTAPSLSRTWLVTVRPAAPRQLRQLDRELTGILEALEKEGEFLETATFHQDLSNHANLLVRTLAAKGVVRLLSARPSSGEDTEIRISAVGTGGPARLDWSAFDVWVTEFLTSERMRGKCVKLAATGSPERHAFIGLSFTTPWPVYHVLDEGYRGYLPSRGPTLPPDHASVVVG